MPTELTKEERQKKYEERQQENVAINRVNRVRQLIAQVNSNIHNVDNLLIYLQSFGIDIRLIKEGITNVNKQVKIVSDKEERAYTDRPKTSKSKSTWY